MDESTAQVDGRPMVVQLGRDVATRAELEHERIVGKVRERAGARKEAKTRKSARTKERILEAASEIIAEQGNATFQLSDVAKRCGMSKGALYYYYPDREALVAQLFDNGIDELVRLLEENAREADSAEAALTGMAQTFVDFLLSGDRGVSAILSGVAAGSMDVLRYVVPRYEAVLELVESQFKRAQAEGAVRADVDTRLAASMACGAFVLTALDRIKSAVPTDSAELGRNLTRLVMHGIRA